MELYGQCSDKLLIGGLCVCVYVLLIKKVMPTTLVVISNGSGGGEWGNISQWQHYCIIRRFYRRARQLHLVRHSRQAHHLNRRLVYATLIPDFDH